MERGRFTIREAAEVLLGTTSRTEPISALVAELVNQGQVTAYGRLGWRWVEVDAAPVHIAKPARRWTEQSLAAATNRLQAWAVRATEQHGHFRRKDAMRDLELPPGIAKALLAELTRSGVLCRLPGSLGYRVAAVAGPAVNVRRGPTRWTKEALGDLRPRLLEFARSETTARGRFTLGAATEALIGGKNTGPVRQILEELKRDGLIEFISVRQGWRALGVETGTTDLGYEAVVWTPEARQELREKLTEYAIEQTRVLGSFTITAAAQALGFSYKKPVAKAIRELVEVGKVVDLGLRWGYYWLNAVPGRVSLPELVHLARQHVSETPDADAPERGRGRQGRSRRRDIRTITSSMVAKARAAAEYAARRSVEEDSSPGAGRLFDWDPTADDGAGNWLLVDCVREWTRNDQSLSEATRYAYVRGVEVLLDLAATHGFITRHPCHLPGFGGYAGEWQPVLEQLFKAITAADPTVAVATVKHGLRVLATYATRLGYLSLEAAKWPEVRAAIEHDHELWRSRQHGQVSANDRIHGLSYHSFRCARSVWQRIPALDDAQAWQTIRDRRRGLVPHQAITRVLADPEHQDFSGWISSQGEPFHALVEGAYGLRRWVRWATAPEATLVREGLPARAWPRPTEEEETELAQARRKGNELFRLSATTLETRLQRVVLLAGWATEHDGFDGRRDDLRSLLDPERMRRYATWRETHPTFPDYDPEREAARKAKGIDEMALALSRIASPFLEAAALQDGDDCADTMRANARSLKKLGYERKPIVNECKVIQEIARAWSTGGRDGLEKLEEWVDLILRDAEQDLGMDLPTALAAIRSGTLAPTLRWALLIRAASVLHFLRKVPLRAFTLSRLELHEWLNHATMPGELARRLEKWEGAIQLAVPAKKMKKRRDFRPSLILQEYVGDPEAQSDLRRILLEAYFMNGGARQILLTRPDGSVTSSSYVFPSPVATGGGSIATRRPGAPWLSKSITSWFRRLVKRYASALGLDWFRLSRMHGACGIHVVRLLFGTYWVKRNRSEQASLMLSHTDVGFTIRLYSGMDEGGVSLVFRTAAGDAPRPVRDTAEVDRMRDALAAAELRADQAEQRSVELLETVTTLTQQVATLATSIRRDAAASALPLEPGGSLASPSDTSVPAT